MLLCALSACGSFDEDEEPKDKIMPKDMNKPVINTKDVVAVPTDCEVYKRGDVIPFYVLFTDDIELGTYNIEIHQNFDHHTHCSSSVECKMDEKKAPVKPWTYNQDFSISSGQKSFTARHDIVIPADIDPGDYHFLVRLADRAGWQVLHAVSIKITE